MSAMQIDSGSSTIPSTNGAGFDQQMYDASPNGQTTHHTQPNAYQPSAPSDESPAAKRQRDDAYQAHLAAAAAGQQNIFPAFTVPIPHTQTTTPMQPLDIQAFISSYGTAPAAPAAEPTSMAESIKRRSRTPSQAATAAASSASLLRASESISRGPGLPLGEVPLLNKRLEKVNNEDPRTKLLYMICFPHHYGAIPDRSAKKTLRQFSGYPLEGLREDAMNRIQELYANDLDLLKKTARLLDLGLDTISDPQVLMEGIVGYLANPSIIVHPPKDESTMEGGGAPTEKKKRSKPKDGKMKRPPNPYLLFATDHREQVTQASPGLAMMEVNRLLGQLWATADPETKTKYTRAAEEARRTWELEHPGVVLPPIGARKRKRADPDTAGGQGGGIDGNGALSDQDSEMSDSVRHPNSTPIAPLSGSSHASPAPTIDHELAAQLSSSIARIIANADLNKFSLRQLKASLAQSFSEKVVTHNQALISRLVDKELLRS